MLTTGCQASALGQAVNEVNRMVRIERMDGLGGDGEGGGHKATEHTHRHKLTHNAQLTWNLADEPASTPGPSDAAERAAVDTKIFLAFTSNLASAGTREVVRWLVEHRMVDVVVTTAGGIEEDIIKVCVRELAAERQRGKQRHPRLSFFLLQTSRHTFTQTTVSRPDLPGRLHPSRRRPAG